MTRRRRQTRLDGRLIRWRAWAKHPPPTLPHRAQVAQLVEHATENRSVGGSIPPLGTILKSLSDLAVFDLQKHP
jgi:hypothetical protein